MITADEEVGGGLGAQWLCEQHPDKVHADFVVNEGGGDLIELAGGGPTRSASARRGSSG